MLAGFGGVLVSDFYAGYDAMGCRQQKCLVHLLRDLNDDLWKNPYNAEYEAFVVEVKELVVPVIETVQRYGLKRRHLRRYSRLVDRFYGRHIVPGGYDSEIVEKYQKRFLRYRESMFRFLEEDGIPWNNNAAERAIRHLAIQRKISGHFFKRVAHKYLRLLGIAQSCRFQDKSFLKFMVSEGNDVDRFRQTRRPRGSIEVGPEAKKDRRGDCG
jgi:hypothetical protein